MAKTEFKVGEVFQCGLVKLKCVKSEKLTSCNGCFCSAKDEPCKANVRIFGKCDARSREDKTDVIFKKVEE